jgi:glyoxylase-like metal-dependent hydrolase (beta-lactamase superfamily II)/rhodanese-related sulfurtransferase
MKIEQIYTGCLAQGTYYIESDGEAVVIDPLREVEPYMQKAETNRSKIKYVFETHFHADFVSGHLDLSNRTGAKIVYGPTAEPSFNAHIAKDGEEFKVGRVTFKLLHTPGHTLESSCFLLKNENGKEIALFSGDTLFIGDVGRPDLAQKAANMTKEELAGMLFESLRNKITKLSDDIIVYPAHGAGSACGKNMSKETSDTLGHQKQFNYALRANMTKEEFVKEVTEGLAAPPSYFPLNVLLNKQGYESIEQVLKRGKQALVPGAFEAAANETHALILDTRDPQVFAAGFIPNSINIGIDGNFAPWVGTLIPDIKQEILIVADDSREEEVITRLARVGYDQTIGYLKGGFSAWKNAGKQVEKIETIDASEFALRLQEQHVKVLDARKPSEYIAERVVNAINIPLDYINDQFASLQQDQTYYVYCAGGYRSMIFASILKSRGFDKVINIIGGFKLIKQVETIPLTDYASPTTIV